MEAVFFVSDEALRRLRTDMVGETGLLGVFDANRQLIYAAATKVYARGAKGSYDLGSTDF
jgi:hypothetical protein